MYPLSRLGCIACCIAVTLPAATVPIESSGLVAHWSFDRNLASSVNNALYAGRAHGGARVRIDEAVGAAKVGPGALKLDSGLRSGDPAFVSIPHPPTGLSGNGVLTLVGWFRLSDVGGDGTDARNFVWESVPNSALSFSVNTVSRRKIAQFRFRSENYRVFQDSTGGPVVTVDAWHHVAMVWNARARHVRVYFDGKLHREMPMKDADQLEPIRGLNLGGNKAGDGVADWDGWLDDLAIFDLELTARQVGALAEGREISAVNVLARIPEPLLQRIAQPSRPLAPPVVPADDATIQGPFLGHVSAHDAVVWARVPRAGEFVVRAKTDDGHEVIARATAAAASDWCLHWRLAGLRPGTSYALTFEPPAESAFRVQPLILRTPSAPEEPARVSLAFGSCAEFPANYIWTRIADECPDGLVMLGDTPYIDTTDLGAMRWAYRRFAGNSTLAAALQRIPFWGTWDDHDFGRNAADGTMPGKENARRAFAEYRPLPQHGENGKGTYASFRRGAVEVFLLDTRWFARTEKSWSDPARDTLLGRQQWEWLQRALRQSTAPFKILTCGMIWSEKGASTETDAWGSYAYERDALFRWLGENRISGVVLIGGDIHVSRLLTFPTRDTVGYELTEFITSPLHDRLIPTANVPDPKLVASAIEPWVFLRVVVDSTLAEPTLVGELINRDGKRFFRCELRASDLNRSSQGGVIQKS
jgi:alkaline phosphatase D